jgi:glutamyl-tRNA synthetase
VRIEDLDPQRSRREYEREQLADLSALGIDWDATPVRQSERLALYEDALNTLRRQQRLYPCFCTRAEIREAASAPHGGLREGAYPGTCLRLSSREQQMRIAGGRSFAWRVRADAERISFEDRVMGRCEDVVDDFVVRRSDGVHAYQLAVVVDDAAQGVAEVVRGADLLDSTPRQILLARLLELPRPRYAHVPLVLAADGSRLAKRHRAATLADRREPVSSSLALLAHTLGLATERDRVRSATELLADFDASAVPREPVVLG